MSLCLQDPEAELGKQRMHNMDGCVPHADRIEAERQRVVSGTHVEAGPYNDKLNNMYMKEFSTGGAVGRSAEMRGRPSQSHKASKTPWRSKDHLRWQKESCPGTQGRLQAEKLAAQADAEEKRDYHAYNRACSDYNVACMASQSQPWRNKDENGYAKVATDLRPAWRKSRPVKPGMRTVVLHGRRQRALPENSRVTVVEGDSDSDSESVSGGSLVM